MSASNRTNTANIKNTYCNGCLETGSLPVVGAINHLNNKDMKYFEFYRNGMSFYYQRFGKRFWLEIPFVGVTFKFK